MKKLCFRKIISMVLAILMFSALLSPVGVQAAGNSGSCSAKAVSQSPIFTFDRIPHQRKK